MEVPKIPVTAEVPKVPVTVNENSYECGTREILKNIRPDWRDGEIKFKVS